MNFSYAEPPASRPTSAKTLPPMAITHRCSKLLNFPEDNVSDLRGGFFVETRTIVKIAEPRIVTVTGKAFFDFNHAPADQSNRRTDLQGYAAWESHPVMKIAVND